MITCKPSEISNPTCVTSLVVLVIRLLVEKFFISFIPNVPTFSNISFLSFLEKAAAIYAAKYPTTTDDKRLPKAHITIFDPGFRTSLIVLPSVWTYFVISFI